MMNVRESFGICSQQDVLFDTLTVEEHLEFYAEVTLNFLDTVYIV